MASADFAMHRPFLYVCKCMPVVGDMSPKHRGCRSDEPRLVSPSSRIASLVALGHSLSSGEMSHSTFYVTTTIFPVINMTVFSGVCAWRRCSVGQLVLIPRGRLGHTVCRDSQFSERRGYVWRSLWKSQQLSSGRETQAISGVIMLTFMTIQLDYGLQISQFFSSVESLALTFHFVDQLALVSGGRPWVRTLKTGLSISRR